MRATNEHWYSKQISSRWGCGKKQHTAEQHCLNAVDLRKKQKNYWFGLEPHALEAIGSMVLLYMVCHGSHQYTPVMLADIPAPWILWGMICQAKYPNFSYQKPPFNVGHISYQDFASLSRRAGSPQWGLEVSALSAGWSEIETVWKWLWAKMLRKTCSDFSGRDSCRSIRMLWMVPQSHGLLPISVHHRLILVFHQLEIGQLFIQHQISGDKSDPAFSWKGYGSSEGTHERCGDNSSLSLYVMIYMYINV